MLKYLSRLGSNISRGYNFFWKHQLLSKLRIVFSSSRNKSRGILVEITGLTSRIIQKFLMKFLQRLFQQNLVGFLFDNHPDFSGIASGLWSSSRVFLK